MPQCAHWQHLLDIAEQFPLAGAIATAAKKVFALFQNITACKEAVEAFRVRLQQVRTALATGTMSQPMTVMPLVWTGTVVQSNTYLLVAAQMMGMLLRVLLVTAKSNGPTEPEPLKRFRDLLEECRLAVEVGLKFVLVPVGTSRWLRVRVGDGRAWSLSHRRCQYHRDCQCFSGPDVQLRPHQLPA